MIALAEPRPGLNSDRCFAARSSEHPCQLPVQGCMFSNFIRTPPTCGCTSINYASMPLNCIRPLPNCTRTLSNYMRTLPNYTCTLSTCKQLLRNCKRKFPNYIAKNPNKTAQISAICRRNPPLPRFSLIFCLTWQTTLLESARFWLAPENAPSRNCGALTLLGPTKIDQRNLLADCPTVSEGSVSQFS
jgi:hypothetical protein